MLRRLGKFESLEPRCMLASDWQNAVLHGDVDRSGQVSPLDALLVINDLNGVGAGQFPARVPEPDELMSDVSGDRWLTPLDALLIINVLNALSNHLPTVVGGLAPSSDPNNNGVVLAEQVSLDGQTLSESSVSVFMEGTQDPIASSIADASGRFTLNLAIAEGLQTLRIAARDQLGRLAEMRLEVRRGNAIQDWNAAALNVIREWSTLSNDPFPNRIVTSQPPVVARNLAMIHIAMFDAVNAVAGAYTPYLVHLEPQTDASPAAAAAAAAHEVAKALYSAPDELNVWRASLDETLAQESDAEARDRGIELGRAVGQAILADRAGDTNVTSPYQVTNEVGRWRRSAPDYLPPLLPQWPSVKPFALTAGAELRPLSPPELDSPEYAAAVDQVLRLGAFQSSERTAEQTEIALFWGDGGGTFTPPGHWNAIASDVTLAKATDLLGTARTFALMNIALADAGIAAWDSKYHYDLWRPIDAIRQGDLDGNPGTVSDSTWLPLLKTPPFPSYTSGHSAFSGAASTVLAALLGENFAFASRADGHTAPEQRPLDPALVVTRHFSSFWHAAEEAGMSRIYGGIHFSFDNTAGLELGRQIGSAVLERLMHRQDP